MQINKLSYLLHFYIQKWSAAIFVDVMKCNKCELNIYETLQLKKESAKKNKEIKSLCTRLIAKGNFYKANTGSKISILRLATVCTKRKIVQRIIPRWNENKSD